MPDLSDLKPLNVDCKGGLILDRSPQGIPPGAALRLENFEPDLNGGYRRMDGFSEYSSSALSGSGVVLGVSILGSQVIGCRGDNVQYGTGSSWTNIATNRTSAGKYLFDKYNWTGTEILIMASGQAGTNPAATWDGTTYTLMNGALGAGAGTAPTNPTCVAEHSDHVFYGQGITLTFSAPFDANDFTAGNGAGSITIPETIVAIKPFRKNLFVFAENSIYKITGTALADFAMESVSDNIGCMSAWSVQEIAGDLMWLAPDGLRTISGTAKIDDIELATISKPIQPRLQTITDVTGVSSMVIRNKSQYRIWYPTSAVNSTISPGIIASLRRQGDDNTEFVAGWEFADIVGIKPYSAYSGFISNVETHLHGDYADGKIYKQESGNLFGTATINAIFHTPHFDFGDVGIRKTSARLITTVEHDGSSEITLYVIYDYGNINAPQPDSYTIGAPTGVSVYGTAVYGTDEYATDLQGWDRLSLEGSGFVIAFQFENKVNNAESFSIQSYQLEVDPGGRR
jgi:hypothetical protein|tara:strand:- start:2243 stop:3781 length:1539 start_codon:yes stop_codon:yes gene_type:complete